MRIIIIILSLFFTNSSLCQEATTDSISSHWIDSTLNQMTLNEKIGQLFMIAVYSNQGEEYESNMEEQILRYHPGGLIFFQGNPVRQVQLTNRYQKLSRIPLLIGLDAEHGAGWRLKDAMEFPKMGIIGAIRNDSLIFALGETIGRHCHELGVHINFAPVVDINSNPSNPVIGIRSFGEDPENVAQKAILFMKGSLVAKTLPVAKHFPGHGDTDSDSHKTLPYIQHTKRRLDSIELYPYRALIEAGIPAIMISHLNVPALDTNRIPATLSHPIVTDLLKNSLGFHGLCITDAMNMKGVTQNNAPGEADAKALLAGNDILLFPEDLGKAITAIQQLIDKGQITEKEIEQHCRKILAYKYKYALSNQFPAEKPSLWSRLNNPKDIALKQRLYREAITLVQNSDDLLPLKRLDTLSIASLNFGSENINNFQTMLSRYAQIKHYTIKNNLSDEDIQKWQQKLKGYNCIIIYNSTANNSFGKKFGYNRNLVQLIKAIGEKRIILCHPAIPYGLKNYMKLPTDAILVSYENHLYAQQYAAQAVFGGIGINGQLPVSIDSQHTAGFGIQTKKNRLGYEAPENHGISSLSLDSIEIWCKKAIKMKATPGCQVLIAYQGNIIYNKAFGTHKYNSNQANTPADIYDIASVTKITATLPAVMKLYEEGKIALDTPLSRYYTALANTNKKDITLKETLCHQTGLATFIPFFSNAIDKKSMKGSCFSTKRTQTHTLQLQNRLFANPNFQFKDSTLSCTPKNNYIKLGQGLYIFPSYQDSIEYTILNSPLNEDKKYAYSDLGFILLQRVVENVSNLPLDRYCKEQFFRPLGMNNTDFCAAERLSKSRIVPSCNDKLYRKNEIEGYVHDPTAALLGGIAGNAGLFSTAEDIAKILQMYLNKGSYGGEHYFQPATIETFTKRNEYFTENRRGLGFDKPETDSTKISPVCKQTPPNSFGHTGFTGIIAWCDPDNELLYIFMSNRTYPNEFNKKLSEENIRTHIQEIIYNSLPLRKKI